jgi:chemotaxis signal transduction protein
MAAYVRLTVAAEAYAVPVEHALEIADLGEVTALPGAPPEILGVRSLRGRLLPVVDLAALLGISRTVPPARLLVTEAAGQQAGFAIDEVTAVGELAEATEETRSALLAGAILADGELIGVLDVPGVFAAIEQGRRPGGAPEAGP